jgi:hypothetical protein
MNTRTYDWSTAEAVCNDAQANTWEVRAKSDEKWWTVSDSTAMDQAAAEEMAASFRDEEDDEPGALMDFHAAFYIRQATIEERNASRDAAKHDGGAGVILVDEDGNVLRADDRGADSARRCFVQE